MRNHTMKTQGYFQKKNVVYALQLDKDGVHDTTHWGLTIYEKGDWLLRQGEDTWICKNHIFEKTFEYIADDIRTVHASGLKTLSDLDPEQKEQARLDAIS